MRDAVAVAVEDKRKLTIRPDEEVATAFTRFCAAQGVTITSLIQVYMEFAVERHRAQRSPTNTRRAPGATRPERRHRRNLDYLIDRAREIDAERRGRR